MDDYGGFIIRKKELLAEFVHIKGDFALGKKTSNLFRYRNNNSRRINVKNFNHVLNIDTKNMFADVEGMTTYESLVEETLKYDLMPTVVPQLKSITIGGALSGGGIESSSFKYGLVHETVEEIEVLLGNGETIVCTRNNRYKDLFFGFANSYGTLGYVLRLKVKLVKVKPYVKLIHTKYSNSQQYFKDIKKICIDSRKNISSEGSKSVETVEDKDLRADFIDGTIFNPKEMYVTRGQFVDYAPFTSNYKYMYIYYKSIKKKSVDYLSIKNYIWRWDTDWFWCSKHFGVQNPVIRLFAGPLLKSTTYWKIRNFASKIRITEKIDKIFDRKVESVIQDVEIPVENAAEFLEYFSKNVGITPVWMCPTMPYDNKSKYTLYVMDPKTLYINFGFWDVVSTGMEDGYINKKIESVVEKLHGKKSLYSTVYYEEKKFWELYNEKIYNKLKEKYDSKHKFKNLYEKCVLRK